jgi:hypothetical protein
MKYRMKIRRVWLWAYPEVLRVTEDAAAGWRAVDISLAGCWIEVASIDYPPGEVVISMRSVSVFANGPDYETERLQACLRASGARQRGR